MAGLTNRGEYRVYDAADGPRIGRNMIRASVQMLDDTCAVFDISKKASGSDLMDRVYDKVDLVEKEYFGLLYSDDHNLMQWVDERKKLRRQVSKRDKHTPMTYYFRVRFYTPDPATLSEEVTRYQFFLQVRQDLFKGRLEVSAQTLAVLGAYVIQSELGDYDEKAHTEAYVSEFRLFPNQTADDEKRISEAHQQMKGLTPADCERYFLDRCQRIALYGIEMHVAVDSNELDLELGVSHSGLSVFQSKEKINHFPWASMSRMTFKKLMFFIHQRAIEETLGMPQTIGFRMPSYRAAKKVWKSSVATHTFFRFQAEEVRPKAQTSGLFRVGSRYRYSGRTHYQTMEFARKSVRFDHGFTRKPSSRYQRRKQSNDLLPHSSVMRQARQEERYPPPPEPQTELGEGVNEMDSGEANQANKPQPQPPAQDYAPDCEDLQDDQTLYPPDCFTSDGQSLMIIMRADSAGRFGFNVKGGADQNQPVIVSKITDDSPAAKTRPPLHVGDELVRINDANARELTHDQVVQAIRQSRDASPPVLQLVIKPLTPIRRESDALNAVADMKRRSMTMLGADAGPAEFLKSSMTQLEEGLDKDDTVLSHFDQLYRKKPDMSLTDAFIPENYCRNRYRDIAPYNDTRVKIHAKGRDYINASYVKTQVGKNTLDYIAAQGPLPHTMDDFWEMVWEQSCQLVVMVTAEEEGGRTKCERYWPNGTERVQVWDVMVKLVEEKDRGGLGILRILEVEHCETKEVRTITQLQYLNWPDHGEPEDSADFIRFVSEANKMRKPNQDLLVHCSAGVGRTGMYICMETALAMMRNHEPIYPLEIVRNVRDQRPMVIQTAQQYEFVCRAILKAFNEGMYGSVLAQGSAATQPSTPQQQQQQQPLQPVEETDGIPGALRQAKQLARDKAQRHDESDSESDDSDSDSSDSSDDDDDDDEHDDGKEHPDDFRLNPMALDDD